MENSHGKNRNRKDEEHVEVIGIKGVIFNKVSGDLQRLDWNINP